MGCGCNCGRSRRRMLAVCDRLTSEQKAATEFAMTEQALEIGCSADDQLLGCNVGVFADEQTTVSNPTKKPTKKKTSTCIKKRQSCTATGKRCCSGLVCIRRKKSNGEGLQRTGLCKPCRPEGRFCLENSNCCSGFRCQKKTNECVRPTCQKRGKFCLTNSNCCRGLKCRTRRNKCVRR